MRFAPAIRVGEMVGETGVAMSGDGVEAAGIETPKVGALTPPGEAAQPANSKIDRKMAGIRWRDDRSGIAQPPLAVRVTGT